MGSRRVRGVLKVKRWGLLAPLLAAGTAVGFVVHRVARTPFAPYGDFGAAHLEHEVRLATAVTWAETQGSLWEKLVAVDGQYPPLLHVLTMPLSSVFGYEVADIAWTGLLWLALLAVAVAATARSISGSWVPASAAASLVFLWPVAPAVASRYYYDLPLTAVLWTAAAVAVMGWDGASPLDRSLSGAKRALAQLAVALPFAVLVGLLAAAACGVKWTALAFAPILVGAAFFTPVHRDRLRWRLPVRLLALGVATAVGSLVLWQVATHLGRMSSLATTFNDMWPGVGNSLYTDDGVFMPLGARALLSGDGPGGSFLKPGLIFYPLTLLTAVLSPLFAAALAPALIHWVRYDRRGAPFVAVAVGGQYLFLAVIISALDERFLLTLAPGILLAAALGWSSLPARPRRWTAAAVVASALFVSVDVHYGNDLPWATPIELPVGAGNTVTARGVSLGDSWEQRGWARLDSQRPPRMQARRMIWALMHQCAFGPAAISNAPLGSAPFGERHWLEYRSYLRTLGAAPPDPVIVECEAWTGPLAGIDRGDVVRRDLLQRAAVEVLDGTDPEHQTHVRGCVAEAFPALDAPSVMTFRASDLLRLELEAPRCLTAFD